LLNSESHDVDSVILKLNEDGTVPWFTIRRK
jgi:hypothetical protein